MKNNLENILKKIKYDTAPEVDVTEKVMSTIKNREYEVVEHSPKSLMLVAALSSAAAACLLIIAAVIIKLNQEPLAEIVEEIAWVF